MGQSEGRGVFVVVFVNLLILFRTTTGCMHEPRAHVQSHRASGREEQRVCECVFVCVDDDDDDVAAAAAAKLSEQGLLRRGPLSGLGEDTLGLEELLDEHAGRAEHSKTSVLDLSQGIVGVDAVVRKSKGVKAKVTGDERLGVLEANVHSAAEGVDAGLALGLGGAGQVPESALHDLAALQGRQVILKGETLVVDLGEGGYLHEGNDEEDLGEAKGGDGGQGLDGVQLRELGGELEALEARGGLDQLRGHHAEGRQHSQSPMLELGVTQPVHVKDLGQAKGVEAKVAHQGAVPNLGPGHPREGGGEGGILADVPLPQGAGAGLDLLQVIVGSLGLGGLGGTSLFAGLDGLHPGGGGDGGVGGEEGLGADQARDEEDSSLHVGIKGGVGLCLCEGEGGWGVVG